MARSQDGHEALASILSSVIVLAIMLLGFGGLRAPADLDGHARGQGLLVAVVRDGRRRPPQHPPR